MTRSKPFLPSITPHGSPLRRRLLGAAAVALSLSACAAGGLPFGAKTIEVSESQLLQTLATHFPITRRVGDVIEVRLTDPSLRFMPETNRLGTRVNASVAIPLLGRATSPYQLSASYSLRYEAADGTVRLKDWRWDSLPTLQLPTLVQEPFNRWTQAFADGLVRDHVVHRLSEADRAKLQSLGVVPTIQVLPQGLRIAFERR